MGPWASWHRSSVKPPRSARRTPPFTGAASGVSRNPGVITGHTLTTDEAKLGSGSQAVTELRVTGETNTDDIVSFASTTPEVDQVLTITGDVTLVHPSRHGRGPQHVVNRFRSTSVE